MIKDIPISLTFNLSSIDEKTVDLIKYYEFLIRNITKKQFMCFSRQNDPRKYRFYNRFKEIIEISLLKDSPIPNPKDFIFFVLKNHGNIYPNRILTNKNLELYLQSKYKPETKIIRDKDFILNEIKKTLNKIKSFYLREYGNNQIDYKKLYKNKKFAFLIESGIISPYFLCLSKNYKKELDIYFEEIYKEDILDTIKEIIGEEFNENITRNIEFESTS